MTFHEFQDRPVRIEVFARTDAGMKRTQNQDSFLIADLSRSGSQGGFRLESDMDPEEMKPGRFVSGPKGALLVVADGMGGAAAGAVASKLASSYIYEAVAASWLTDRNNSPSQFASRIVEAVESANASVHATGTKNPDFRGMGSTATVVGILDGFLYLAQVGDSRAYVVRAGETRQVTRDQSIVQEMLDAGQITEAEAMASQRRNVILQALGANPTVEVDLTYQQIRRGDVIVLCSDGLSGLVRHDEIGAAVEAADDLVAACDDLIAMANSRGGPDNITVIAARLDGEGLEEPGAGDAVGRRVYELP
jgi:protein phosphatase